MTQRLCLRAHLFTRTLKGGVINGLESVRSTRYRRIPYPMGPEKANHHLLMQGINHSWPFYFPPVQVFREI